MFVRLGIVLTFFMFLLGAAAAGTLEPQLHFDHNSTVKPRVALTLDLCMGDTDHRIFDTLIDKKIKATLFVTKRWLKRNPDVVAAIKQHLDLFEVANHGANHIPAVDNQPTLYGMKTAGSLTAICDEIEQGQQALRAAGFAYSNWYRDAGARYSPHAIDLIHELGYHIAGFSLNGDVGASLPEAVVRARIEKARDGDVIIAHMNQPRRSAGAGVAQAITALQARGFDFVKLSDAFSFDKSQKKPKTCAEILATTGQK